MYLKARKKQNIQWEYLIQRVGKFDLRKILIETNYSFILDNWICNQIEFVSCKYDLDQRKFPDFNVCKICFGTSILDLSSIANFSQENWNRS